MFIEAIMGACVVIAAIIDVSNASRVCRDGYHWSCDGDGCCPGSGGSGVYGNNVDYADCCVENSEEELATIAPTTLPTQPTRAATSFCSTATVQGVSCGQVSNYPFGYRRITYSWYGDYESFVNATPQWCCALCAADARCSSWSHQFDFWEESQSCFLCDSSAVMDVRAVGFYRWDGDYWWTSGGSWPSTAAPSASPTVTSASPTLTLTTQPTRAPTSFCGMATVRGVSCGASYSRRYFCAYDYGVGCPVFVDTSGSGDDDDSRRPSQAWCCSLCAADARCSTWSYAVDYYNTEQSLCLLCNSSAVMVRENNIDSYGLFEASWVSGGSWPPTTAPSAVPSATPTSRPTASPPTIEPTVTTAWPTVVASPSAMLTTLPTASTATPSASPLITAPVSAAPTPTPTLAPDDESVIAVSLTINGQARRTRDVAAMTDAEELSLTNGCVLSLLDRINNVVDSGNGARITVSDVSRTTLEDKTMRRARRSYEVDFAMYFPVATVSARMVTLTAKTITSDNPLVVNYTTHNGSTALAVATSATATSPAAEAANSGDSVSSTALIVVVVIGGMVVVVAVIDFVVVRRDRNARRRRVTTDALDYSGDVHDVVPECSPENMMTHSGSNVQESPILYMTSRSTTMVDSAEEDVASRASVVLAQTTEV